MSVLLCSDTGTWLCLSPPAPRWGLWVPGSRRMREQPPRAAEHEFRFFSSGRVKQCMRLTPDQLPDSRRERVPPRGFRRSLGLATATA